MYLDAQGACNGIGEMRATARAFCARANARCMRVLVRVSCVRACRCVNKAHGGRATGTRDRPGAQREPEWGGCHRVRLGVALAIWAPSLGGVTAASRTRRKGLLAACPGWGIEKKWPSEDQTVSQAGRQLQASESLLSQGV